MASVIPKQNKKERDQITIRLDRDVLQNLEHYCRYLESCRDYAMNPCLTFFSQGLRILGLARRQGLAATTESNGAVAAWPSVKSAGRKPKSSATQHAANSRIRPRSEVNVIPNTSASTASVRHQFRLEPAHSNATRREHYIRLS